MREMSDLPRSFKIPRPNNCLRADKPQLGDSDLNAGVQRDGGPLGHLFRTRASAAASKNLHPTSLDQRFSVSVASLLLSQRGQRPPPQTPPVCPKKGPRWLKMPPRPPNGARCMHNQSKCRTTVERGASTSCLSFLGGPEDLVFATSKYSRPSHCKQRWMLPAEGRDGSKRRERRGAAQMRIPSRSRDVK